MTSKKKGKISIFDVALHVFESDVNSNTRKIGCFLLKVMKRATFLGYHHP